MEFLTVVRGDYSYEIKRSQFICRIERAKSEDEAKAFIAAVKKEHSMANHNCYAYIVKDESGERVRYSDDGEPQGTAGLPILNVIKSRGLVGVVVVVTRYFGGIKLGAGGLVRSYTQACAGAVDNALVKRCVFCDRFSIPFSYENYKIFRQFKLPELSLTESIEYGEKVNVILAVNAEDSNSFISAFDDYYNKKQPISRLNPDYIEFDVARSAQ